MPPTVCKSCIFSTETTEHTPLTTRQTVIHCTKFTDPSTSTHPIFFFIRTHQNGQR